MTRKMKKALLLIQEECLAEVGAAFEQDYPGWQWLARMGTWPPTLVLVVEIPQTEGAREATEMLADLQHKRLISFAACAPATAGTPREAESSCAVWREEATEPYQILYEMNPSGQFVLVFPLERADVVERIQPARHGWHDPDDPMRYRFIAPADANAALWLANIRDVYPEFVVSPSAEAIVEDFLSLPGWVEF